MIQPKLLTAWKATTALAAALAETHQDAAQDAQQSLTETQADDIENSYAALKAAMGELTAGGA